MRSTTDNSFNDDLKAISDAIDAKDWRIEELLWDRQVWKETADKRLILIEELQKALELAEAQK